MDMLPIFDPEEWRVKYNKIRKLADTLQNSEEYKKSDKIRTCNIEAQKKGIKCVECDEEI